MRVKKAFNNFFTSGMLTSSAPEEVGRFILFNVLSLLGSTFLILFIGISIKSGNFLIAAIDSTALVGMCAMVVYLRITKKLFISAMILMTMMSLLFLYHLGSGGVGGAGYLWSFPLPIALMFLLGGKPAFIYSALYLVAAAILMYLPTVGAPLYEYSQHVKFRFLASLTLCIVIAYFFDSIRRKVHEQLVRKNDEIKHTLKQLKRTNQDLERFALVGSHHIQEPLRNIASYVQLIKNRYRGQLDKDADEFIDYVVDGTVWMKQLLNDLLEYTHIGSNGIARERVDTAEVLKDVLAALDAKITKTNASIVFGSLPVITGDRVLLTKVFKNCIDNSLKFHNDQPLEIIIDARLEQKNDAPVLTTEIIGGYWLFSIRDNGIGIPDEYHLKVFEVFEKLHPRTKYPGTGIGLAICKKVIEAHGGRIWVTSSPAGGCTLFFTIPNRFPEKNERV